MKKQPVVLNPKQEQQMICNADERMIAIVFKKDGQILVHRHNSTPMDAAYAEKLCKEIADQNTKTLKFI